MSHSQEEQSEHAHLQGTTVNVQHLEEAAGAPLSTVCIYEAIEQLCRVHGCLQNMFRLSLADFLISTDSAVNSSSIDQCFSSLLAYAHSHCVVHSPGSVFYM